MTDLLVGATAGLSSSASRENTAGQASSGTQTIIPLCHMPTKRTGLLRTEIAEELAHCVHRGGIAVSYAEIIAAFFLFD
jgi:hypothetical protein